MLRRAGMFGGKVVLLPLCNRIFDDNSGLHCRHGCFAATAATATAAAVAAAAAAAAAAVATAAVAVAAATIAASFTTSPVATAIAAPSERSTNTA